MNPKITVITVTYNALPALQQTLKSFDLQDYSDTECIIVDGFSDDGTSEFLRSYKGIHSILWISEPDRGIYDAMNKGVRMAHGEYCIFMNAADTFVNKHTLCEVVEKGLDAEIVYGDIIKQGKIKRSLNPRNCHKMYYCHQSAFIRTTCLKEFPFDINYRMSADFKQSKQLFLAGKSFKHIDVIVTDFDTCGISNIKRSSGLLDNIRVVNEIDCFKERLRLLPRLCFSYISCKVKGK